MEEILQSEEEILAHLRKELKNYDISLQIEKIENQANTKDNSPEELFKEMSIENADFKDFTSVLDLNF